jgi:hypothetical protein
MIFNECGLQIALLVAKFRILYQYDKLKNKQMTIFQ